MFFHRRTALLLLLSGLLIACGRAPVGGDAPLTPKSRMPADPAIKSLYLQSCYGCHSSGAGGAPRTGVANDWRPRFAQGLPVLLAHTVNGINRMPARGMCMNCSEAEFLALIQFMGTTETADAADGSP